MNETPNGTSGWTLSTLYVHLTGVISELRVHTEQRFNDSEKAVKAALDAADKAVAAALQAQKEAAEKAERSAEARHGDLVMRLNTTADTLTEKITSLALRYEGSVGTGLGTDKVWGFLGAAAGIGVAILAILVK